MKSKVIISCIILHIFSLSCQIGNKQIKNDETILIDLKESPKKLYLSKFLTHNEYISLETTPSCLIGRIQKIEIYKDQIFILDPFIAKKLLVFDMSGKFLYQISERGKGPGEYMDIFDFVIRENKIYILNDRTSVIEYTIDGVFIKTYPLPFWAERMLSVSKNHWGLLSNFDKSYGYDFNFYVTSLDFNNEKGSLKNKYDDFPYSPPKQVCLLNDTSYFFLPFNNIIYSANKKGVRAKYLLQFPDNCLVNDSELKDLIKLPVKARIEKLLDNSIFISSIIFTDKLKMITYFQKNKPYLCFLKSEIDYISASEEKIVNDIDSVPFLPVFYSTMNPNNIIASFDTYKIVDALNSDFEIGSRIKKTISENTGESNPIIVIYSSDKSK